MKPILLDGSAFIENEIEGEFYFTGQHGVDGAAAEIGAHAPVIDSLSALVFCVLILRGGLTVTGGSVCRDGDQDAAAKLAREGALAQVRRSMLSASYSPPIEARQ